MISNVAYDGVFWSSITGSNKGGEAPLIISIPPFEGEGDKGGEVELS